MTDTAPDRAYEAGKHYEQTYYGCAQCVVAALQDTFDRRNDDIFRAATALSGGGGLTTDGSCGAYAGAIMFFGQMLGRDRDDFADEAGVRLETAAMARALRGRFVEEYGSVVCRNIHGKLMGRPYFIADPDEFQKFHDAGAHDDVCPEVVGKGARWAAEIVEDRDLA